MTMVTQCPHCETLFRVTPRQLQMREGRVRCGRCRTVFDGFQTLDAEPERVHVEHLEEREAVSATVTEAAEPVAPAETVAQGANEPADDFNPLVEDEPVVAAAESPRAVSDRMPDAAALLPEATESETAPARPWATRLFATGSVLLVLVLIMQTAFEYRSDIAARFGGLRPIMSRWCGALGCTVALPQRPKLISIEASDLQVIDPQRPGLIRLTATLRSHAPYDVGYPALDLVLTNVQDHTLARRIFLPHEYLAGNRDPGAGLPPSDELTVQLDLDATGLGAAGFRLDLLAAPG